MVKPSISFPLGPCLFPRRGPLCCTEQSIGGKHVGLNLFCCRLQMECIFSQKFQVNDMMLALCVAGKFGEPPDKLEPVDVSSGSPMPFLNALDPVEWICFTAVFRKLTAKSPLLKRADCRANSYGILPMRNDHDHCHTLPLKATGYQK